MDYQSGKIYCISNGDLYYVGSTINELKTRLRGHRGDYFQYVDGKNHYKSSYEIIKTGKHSISLIENYPCQTKAELVAREYEIIKEYKALHGEKCVNIEGVKPLQTAEEYAEKARERANIYYAEHKEKCRTTQMEYYEKNKEHLKEASREYGIKNKAILDEKRFTIVECECGKTSLKCNLARHQKTKYHLDNLN